MAPKRSFNAKTIFAALLLSIAVTYGNAVEVHCDPGGTSEVALTPGTWYDFVSHVRDEEHSTEPRICRWKLPGDRFDVPVQLLLLTERVSLQSQLTLRNSCSVQEQLINITLRRFAVLPLSNGSAVLNVQFDGRGANQVTRALLIPPGGCRGGHLLSSHGRCFAVTPGNLSDVAGAELAGFRDLSDLREFQAVASQTRPAEESLELAQPVLLNAWRACEDGRPCRVLRRVPHPEDGQSPWVEAPELCSVVQLRSPDECPKQCQLTLRQDPSGRLVLEPQKRHQVLPLLVSFSDPPVESCWKSVRTCNSDRRAAGRKDFSTAAIIIACFLVSFINRFKF